MPARSSFALAITASLLGAVAACSSCSSPEPQVVSPFDASADGPDTGADAADALAESDAKDAAEDVYGSNWNDGTVISDPAVWTAVPDNGGCGLFVGKVVPDPFPKRTWKPCGNGCEVADAPLPLPYSNSVSWGGVTASERGGEIYLRAKYGVYAHGSLLITERLSDGATVAAAQMRHSSCVTYGWANDAAFVFPIFGDAAGRGGTIGGTEPGSPVTWGKWLPFAGFLDSTFAWDAGWGLGVGSSLIATTSLSDTKFTVIAKPANGGEVYGRGDLIVWRGGEDGGPAVRSYSVAGGVKTLWKGLKGWLHAVSLDDQRLLWIVVDGPEVTTKYRFETAELYWSPRSADPALIQASTPLSLTNVDHDLFEIRAAAGYAAMKGCLQTGPTTGECPLYVVHLESGKIWKIPARPGSVYVAALAMSANYILVTEVDLVNPGQPQNAQQIQRFVRLRVSELDNIQVDQ